MDTSTTVHLCEDKIRVGRSFEVPVLAMAGIIAEVDLLDARLFASRRQSLNQSRHLLVRQLQADRNPRPAASSVSLICANPKEKIEDVLTLLLQAVRGVRLLRTNLNIVSLRNQRLVKGRLSTRN